MIDVEWERRIIERLGLCAEQVKESPFSHTVAAGWYLDDVMPLSNRLASAKRDLEEIVRLSDTVESAHLGQIARAALLRVAWTGEETQA